MLHSNSIDSVFYRTGVIADGIKFHIAGREILDLCCCCDLDLDLDPMTVIYDLIHSLEIYRMCK